jgi:carbamoyltransferase
MIVLGINNMHDAAAALVHDNTIVAAAEEERFCRRKHVKGLPLGAIQYCLDEAGISLQDVDVVVAAWRPWVLRVRATLAAKSILGSPQAFHSKASRGMKQMGNEWRELFILRRLLERHFGKGPYQVRYLEHHLAHAASTFYCSSFSESAILTVDGAGEEDSTVLWSGHELSIEKLKSVRLPHSLGQMYSATTAFLGFKVHHDEYKVMGLAANGRPHYVNYLMDNIVKLLPGGGFRIKPFFLDYHMARNGQFSDEVVQLFGAPRKPDEEIRERHADIASSVQSFLEQALFHLLRDLHVRTGSKNLCLAGGVALNCVANGKIYADTPFENVFVQPAAGDDGTALGAALFVDNENRNVRDTPTMEHALLGPSFGLRACEAALEKFGLEYEKLEPGDVPAQAARLLADGNVIGWFQGRMEWGPRALGARSLLADPRRAEMKEKINRVIKKRESFRPFAPSVLEQHAATYFEGYQTSPFMLMTFPVKPEAADSIAAVVHTDGTARPQGVTEKANSRYYRLIECFHELTGVPVVLNTSFNVQEPITCSPEDAIRTFVDSEMDCLVLEDYVVKKTGNESNTTGAAIAGTSR